MTRGSRYRQGDHPDVEEPAKPEQNPQRQKHLPGLHLVGAALDVADLLSESADVVSQVFVSPILHLLLLS
jgi:hypothetical protein